jgi:DNA-binding PadR family transcriptional regulator
LHRVDLCSYAAPVALPQAILVSLCEQSGSGYELTRRFDRSIGYFWSATHQQIYRTLRTMEADGWVSATVVVQHGRPDKKVYTVSDAGRSELARWIAAPLGGSGSGRRGSGRAGALGDNRTREVAVKLRGAAFGDRGALHEQIVALRAERAQLLDTYRGFEKKQFPDPAALRDSALHQYLVLRGGIRAEEGTIDWLDEVTAALETKPKQENR